jgi:tetrahydromethanopterin S-methyltransferase subunit D
MPDNLQSEATPSMSSLVTGIITDAQRLVRQEVLLVRREMQVELEKVKTAVASMAVGAGVSLLAVILLAFCLVYLLNWATGGHTNEHGLPLWACFGIVGACLAVLGGILVYIGATKVSTVSLVPPQTAETMKENVEWLQNQK